MLKPVLLREPRLYKDDRGYFHEVFHSERDVGIGVHAFQQCSLASSKPHVLRGLHLQTPNPQGKFVLCVSGSVFDVVVDAIEGSGTFGSVWTFTLTSDRPERLWVPPGFAHGYCVLGDTPATVMYLCDQPYCEENAKTILWDDEELKIPWPYRDPVLSAKDKVGTGWTAFCVQQHSALPLAGKPDVAQAKSLNLEQVTQLVMLLNAQLRRLPRIVANLLLTEVVTSVDEIATAYHHKDVMVLPTDNEPIERMISWRTYHLCGAPVVGFAELLSVICNRDLHVHVEWLKSGYPQLKIVKR